MSARIAAIVGVQAAFVAIALVWRHVQGASAFHDGTPLGGTHAIALPLSLSLGALVGVLSAWITRHLVRNTMWGRQLHVALREAIIDIDHRASSLVVMALAAALGEELLFRGTVLPSLVPYTGTAGAVVLSSLAFGVLHIPSSRRLVPWTLMAFVMGAVFASLYIVTGEVLCPIAAHAVINYENLHFLLGNDLADRTPPQGNHPATVL
jgi:hypothetical protein